MPDTPRCNALASNPLDSFDHRAWQRLAAELEQELALAEKELRAVRETYLRDSARPEERWKPTTLKELLEREDTVHVGRHVRAVAVRIAPSTDVVFELPPLPQGHTTSEKP